MITGPQSPGVKSQMILSCEQHVDWIADCLPHLRDQRPAPHRAREGCRGCLGAAHQRGRRRHALSAGELVVRRRQHPGKPRVFMPYVGGVTAYKKKCDEVAAKGYEGFRLA